MLVLSRKVNESIVIDGCVTVKILRVEGDVIKLGIQAPSNIPVHRQEIYEEIQRSNREALTSGNPSVAKLSTNIQSRKDNKNTDVLPASVAAPHPKPEQIHA